MTSGIKIFTVEELEAQVRETYDWIGSVGWQELPDGVRRTLVRGIVFTEDQAKAKKNDFL